MIVSMIARLADEILPHLSDIGRGVVAGEPSPGPDSPVPLNTDGIVEFMPTKVPQILLAVLGVILTGRAGKGEMSKVPTAARLPSWDSHSSPVPAPSSSSGKASSS